MAAGDRQEFSPADGDTGYAFDGSGAKRIIDVVRLVEHNLPKPRGVGGDPLRAYSNVQFIRVTGAATTFGGKRYYPGYPQVKSPSTGAISDLVPNVLIWLEDINGNALVTDGTARYSAKQINSSFGVTDTGTITGATNAAPIVITSTAHGLSTGDSVTIASVGGNTAANGTWTITVIDANTFSLNSSTGNGAYTSGGTWSRTRSRPLFETVVQECSTAASDFATIDETQTQPTTKFLVSDPTLGTRNVNAQDLPKVGQKAAGVHTITYSATPTFDLHNGLRQRITLAGNATISIAGDWDTAAAILETVQNGTGGWVPTFWSGITWAGQIQPRPTLTPNGRDLYHFERIASGNYRGVAMLNR